MVSLIPENLFCRKTCRCVQDGEGLMTQPALHTEGQRVMGNDRFLPVFPLSHGPFLSSGRRDLVLFKEQLEGRSPAFPAPWDLLCCGVKQPVPWSRLGSNGGFGVYKGDVCSCHRADIVGHALRRHLGVIEATSSGNFL